MPWLPRHPGFWLASFILWCGVLWGFSSFTLPGDGPPPFQNSDKLAHFGYFFGGSGLLSAWLFRRNPENPNWWKIIATAVLIIAIIGALDEFHQSFTPGRSGNDPQDWAADLLGGIAGAFTFKRLHHLLK
ncbi:MAG: VanZ family protein [Luteolibacter sp.]